MQLPHLSHISTDDVSSSSNSNDNGPSNKEPRQLTDMMSSDSHSPELPGETLRLVFFSARKIHMYPTFQHLNPQPHNESTQQQVSVSPNTYHLVPTPSTTQNASTSARQQQMTRDGGPPTWRLSTPEPWWKLRTARTCQVRHMNFTLKCLIS